MHGGSFLTYQQARDDRNSRLEELRRRWDEEHAKIKALVLMLRTKAAYNDGLASRYQAAQTRLRASRDAARGLSEELDGDDRLVAWERTAAGFVTGGDTHLMTPLPGTVYGPAEWDEASLDDWLAPET